jgi:RNA polymerase sigma-70 factor (ECF subfamily)
VLTTSYSLLYRLRQSHLDGQAWERFVAIYTALLYRWVRSWGLRSNEADDAVQDVLLLLLRKLPAYQPMPNVRFRSWLWAVTRNRVRSIRRRSGPSFQSLEGSDAVADSDTVTDEDAAAELALVTRRAAELFQNDFQSNTWKAFWETAVEGRSGKAVAQELGLTIGAVYAARFRVQQRIREELADFLN